MAGGSAEYVMGAMYNGDNSTISIASTQFAQETIDSAGMSKYIDKYIFGWSSNDQPAFNRSKLGDATGEVIMWPMSSSNYLQFVNSSSPWFIRGGGNSFNIHLGGYGNIFTFTSYVGNENDAISFRVVFVE
jgi:hypothetical protein